MEVSMEAKPYIKYPKPYKTGAEAEVSGKPLINEQGQVSFGINDFKPGIFRALHGHYTWELVLVDSSSEGPGYVYFDGHWWRVNPGAAVFVPKGIPHSWSSGNTTGFRMIWIYGGAREEAGRIWHGKPEEGKCISPEEEISAPTWTA